MKEYKYIRFELIGEKPKTKVWLCLNKNSGFVLGTVKWDGACRQYGWFPEENTVFTKSCLRDLLDFMEGI